MFWILNFLTLQRWHLTANGKVFQQKRLLKNSIFLFKNAYKFVTWALQETLPASVDFLSPPTQYDHSICKRCARAGATTPWHRSTSRRPSGSTNCYQLWFWYSMELRKCDKGWVRKLTDSRRTVRSRCVREKEMAAFTFLEIFHWLLPTWLDFWTFCSVSNLASFDPLPALGLTRTLTYVNLVSIQ